MIKLKIYSIKKFMLDKGTFRVGWVNPNHIMQFSLLDDTGFSVFTMVNGSRGLVDKEGYNQLLQHFGAQVNTQNADFSQCGSGSDGLGGYD